MLQGRGFVLASDLTLGSEFIDYKGSVVPLVQMQTEELDEAVAVYNINVADYHTYHVGHNNILVHITLGITLGTVLCVDERKNVR